MDIDFITIFYNSFIYIVQSLKVYLLLPFMSQKIVILCLIGNFYIWCIIFLYVYSLLQCLPKSGKNKTTGFNSKKVLNFKNSSFLDIEKNLSKTQVVFLYYILFYSVKIMLLFIKFAGASTLNI